MKKYIIAFLLVIMSLAVNAQTFTDSNLPIVVIETDGGASIPEEPKILATMKIIWHQDGSRNYMTDIDNPEFLNYDGRIGVTYSFPDHAIIEGHQAIVLCSDSLMFTEFYNTIPFGQYTRKLSNKSENLVLADAWGNVIDQVHYSDSQRTLAYGSRWQRSLPPTQRPWSGQQSRRKLDHGR